MSRGAYGQPALLPPPQQQQFDPYRGPQQPQMGSNIQGRTINSYVLEVVRDRIVDAQRLDLLVDTYVERMDCVNLATLLFHTGKKRVVLNPAHVKRIAQRFAIVGEELRAREASNALYGLKCLSADIPEVRELVGVLAMKISQSNSQFVAQAVGNALYGCQLMSSEHEEVRHLLAVLAMKVERCTELLEAQNVGNALYGMRQMNSDHKEVRLVIAALTPKIISAKEEFNGQAVGNSLYGLQGMSSKEPEVRCLLQVLAGKVARAWEDLKAQEVGNALYGLRRMTSDVLEVRRLIAVLVPKIVQSPDVLDAQAIGNCLYGLQAMHAEPEVLELLNVLAVKISSSFAELDGQAMGNSVYGLQGMSSDYPEVRAVLSAVVNKIQASYQAMNGQELGNALYGLQNMTSTFPEVRQALVALAAKVSLSKHELTSQEIGNALLGVQGMSSVYLETRTLLAHLTQKIVQSPATLDPQAISSLLGLQRMSSECVEVRQLVVALAYKMEHCWKALTGHQLSNALYGLQGMSSEEKEVRILLTVLLPKVTACQEMNSKQISLALFGLHKMSGHQEVNAIIGSLADRASLTDAWSGYHMSIALFSLQGMSGAELEVKKLLQTLTVKANVDMDPDMLGNAFYGLQRCDSAEAQLVAILASKLPHPRELSAAICANIIFGMNGMSANIPAVREVLTVLMAAIGVLSNESNLIPMQYMDLVALYQAATVSVAVMPDLADYEIHGQMISVLAKLQRFIEAHSTLYQTCRPTPAEVQAVQEISAILAREPASVHGQALVYGFDLACFIQVQLPSFKPTVGVDVIGSSFSFPVKQLYHRLRCAYLEQVGVPMRAVPADAFRQGGMWRHMSIFRPLLPISAEDAALINNQLPVPYMSTLTNETAMPMKGVDYIDDDLLQEEQVLHRRPLGMVMGWLGEWPRIGHTLVQQPLPFSMQTPPISPLDRGMMPFFPSRSNSHDYFSSRNHSSDSTLPERYRTNPTEHLVPDISSNSRSFTGVFNELPALQQPIRRLSAHSDITDEDLLGIGSASNSFFLPNAQEEGDEDELELLQAQLEMAKLDAKIKALQNKKTVASTSSAGATPIARGGSPIARRSPLLGSVSAGGSPL